MKTNTTTTAAHTIAESFNTSLKALSENKNERNILNAFKKGDVIACWAGSPSQVLCIVEIENDGINADNYYDYISNRSYMPLTSHIISGQWFKIN